MSLENLYGMKYQGGFSSSFVLIEEGCGTKEQTLPFSTLVCSILDQWNIDVPSSYEHEISIRK